MKDRENKKVEVRTKSGEKFATEHGFNAIKDGIKQTTENKTANFL